MKKSVKCYECLRASEVENGVFRCPILNCEVDGAMMCGCNLESRDKKYEIN